MLSKNGSTTRRKPSGSDENTTWPVRRTCNSDPGIASCVARPIRADSVGHQLGAGDGKPGGSGTANRIPNQHNVFDAKLTHDVVKHIGEQRSGDLL